MRFHRLLKTAAAGKSRVEKGWSQGGGVGSGLIQVEGELCLCSTSAPNLTSPRVRSCMVEWGLRIYGPHLPCTGHCVWEKANQT